MWCGALQTVSGKGSAQGCSNREQWQWALGARAKSPPRGSWLLQQKQRRQGAQMARRNFRTGPRVQLTAFAAVQELLVRLPGCACSWSRSTSEENAVTCMPAKLKRPREDHPRRGRLRLTAGAAVRCLPHSLPLLLDTLRRWGQANIQHPSSLRRGTAGPRQVLPGAEWPAHTADIQ